MHQANAQDFLAFGDALRDRADRDTQPLIAVAADLDVSPGVATKAAWLARVYPATERAELGRETLAALKPSHLEAAAKAPREIRAQLLRRVAAEGLGVRAVKQLADSAGTTSTQVVSTFGADDLVSSARAVDTYLAFNDDQLRRLLAGPRGPTVKALAFAGAALAVRIGDSSINTAT